MTFKLQDGSENITVFIFSCFKFRNMIILQLEIHSETEKKRPEPVDSGLKTDEPATGLLE